MHFSHESADYFLQTPDVGHGNPAMLLAIAKELVSAGALVELSTLDLSALPVRAMHAQMTRSSSISSSYTVRSESLRRSSAARMFAILAKQEMELRTQTSARTMIGVQEHQFGAFLPHELADRFPSGVYLSIPDVYPKDSAITELQRLGMTALVWNTDAYTTLIDRGIDVALVKPSLPFAYSSSLQAAQYPVVLMKSSGSGMPDSYSAALVGACADLSLPYELWLPHSVETSDGGIDLSAKRWDAIETTYSRLATTIPRLLISYPSEMIQILAVWHSAGIPVQFLSLPPRGAHEQRNLQWAQEKGLVLAVIDPEDRTVNTLHQSISNAWESSHPPVSLEQLGLGDISVALTLQSRNRE